MNADGSFDYTPDKNFSGSDSFEYQVCDPSSECDTGIVSIAVLDVPDPELFISKSPSSVDAYPGEVVTFTVAFGNLGPGSATGVVVTDSISGDCTLQASNPLWTGSLLEGEGQFLPVSVQVHDTPGGACTNTVTITSANGIDAIDRARIFIAGTTVTPSPTPTPNGTSALGPQGTSPQAALTLLTPLLLFAGPVLLAALDRGRRDR